MPSRNIFENVDPTEAFSPCEHEISDGDILSWVEGWKRWVKITGTCRFCEQHMTVKFPMPQENQ